MKKIYTLMIGLLAFGLSASYLRAQTQTLVGAEEAAFRTAVEAVARSVVQIETFGGLELSSEELVADGPTTGTIVDADGWIISTLYSFRQQPASILVILPDGSRAAARIVARDYSREVALLKVETDDPLPVARFAPKADLQVGQWAVALGKTYDAQAVSQSVGIISATDRAYGKAIQTDAKVSPINYGGPLIDVSGRVIGILSPISPGTFLEGDSSQLYDSGIGFAIPIEDIVARLPAMRQGTDIHSGKLGVVSADQNEFVGPVRISGASPGSPAAKAHMKAGDVIVSAGGEPITMLAQLKHALGPVDAGQSLSIVVERDGKQVTFEPTLAAEIPIYRRRYLGLRLRRTPRGLLIEDIEPDSPAEKSSLRVGQTITRCDDQPLRSRGDLQNILAVAELDTPLRLHVVPAASPASTAEADGEADRTPGDTNSTQTQVELLATTWPVDMPKSLPSPQSNATDGVEPATDATLQPELVDVVIGDFPNTAYAIIPPRSGDRSLGLLVVFPEPGELDRTKTKAYWSGFCRDYGWIVAVINSGSPNAWSREEIGLAGRVIGRLSNNYSLDKSRTVICGLGVGGRVALAAALMENQRVNGAMTVGTDLSGLGWPTQNAPMQSIDFLLIGDVKRLGPTAESLSKKGYAATAQAAEGLELGKWETLPTHVVQCWLEGLGRL